jgi:excisionase family DNA binding protein
MAYDKYKPKFAKTSSPLAIYLTLYEKTGIIAVNHPSGLRYRELYMAEKEQAWLTVESIAKEVDVSEETVRNWIRKKLLKAYRLGRDYKIKREDFQKFLEDQATK